MSVKDKKATTTIVSSDGKEFQVPSDINIGSTIENLLSDTGDSGKIQLPKEEDTRNPINRELLEIILDFNRCKFIIPEIFQVWQGTPVETFFKQFPIKILVDLTNASDFLEYESLEKACTRCLAEMIKDKSPEECESLFLGI